ncbi:O-antigen ligase family protein [Sphingomonas sp. ERG5]|uniref:O-antigen ligase family protein n=1 Tax=Sphingomonas sp. ERG5 TaxID=1381597 RepID=UPI00054B42CE|nr:O-antigen ligase family protein [Sphingomonas sp. ERG5]
MNRTAPIIPATLFLFVAIVLGGSSRGGVYANAAIQFAAALGIALAIVSRHNYPGGTQKGLLLLLCGAIGLAIFQLIPLPPALWSALPARSIVSDGMRLVGVENGWRQISMTPEGTIGAALSMLPVIAAALIGMRAPRVGLVSLFIMLILLLIVSVSIGLAQRMTGIQSSFYLYDISNRGEATGLFANSNHLATLCVLSIPAATALFVAQRGSTKPNASWLVWIAIVLVALFGVWIANSLAGMGLSLIAVASVFLIARLRRGNSKVRIGVIGAIGVSVLAIGMVAAVLIWGHVSSGQFAAEAEMGRPQLWSRAIKAIGAFMPFGSGVGGFRAVFPQFEDAQTVTRVYANHAHNDILELIMTGGIPAVILMLGFAAWWLRTTIVIWRASTRDAFSEAATVITGIIMLHEFVDYPLRTAAIGVIFGLCCGVMARPRRIVEPEEAPERARRHLAA